MRDQRKTPAGRPGLDQSAQHSRVVQSKYKLTLSPVEGLLARLDGVRKSDRGWRALCPACKGRSRDLSVTESPDGAAWVHCFKCLDTESIMRAVGLSMHDLFPPRPKPTTPAERRAAQYAMKANAWGAALGVVDREAVVIAIVASDLHKGCVLTDVDRQRFELARERIHSARRVLT